MTSRVVGANGKARCTALILCCALCIHCANKSVAQDAQPPDGRRVDISRDSSADGETLHDSRILDVHVPDAPPDPTGTQWVVRIGGAENELLHDLELDGADNVFVAGSFEGTIKLGSTQLQSIGSEDGCVARVTSSGIVDWGVSVGGAGLDRVAGLGWDTTGDLVTVGFLGNGPGHVGSATVSCPQVHCPFIARLDPTSGQVLGVDVFTELNGSFSSVAVAADGRRFVTGSFSGSGALAASTPLVSAGDQDGLVTCLDSGNHPLWAFSFGGEAKDGGYEVSLAPNDAIYQTCWFTGPASYGGHSLAGGETGCLARMDATDGKVEWATPIAPVAAWGALARDTSGNAYVGGNFHGTAAAGKTLLASRGLSDAYLIQFDTTGTGQWGFGGGGPSYDGTYGVAAAKSGAVFFTGYFKNQAFFENKVLTCQGVNNVFVAELGGQGKLTRVVTGGGTGNNSGQAIAIDSTGTAVVGGVFTETGVFGPQSVASAGQADIFVWKLTLQ